VMGDAPRGMKDENWFTDRGDSLDTPRNIVMRGNQFHDIRDYAPLDNGAVTKPITGSFSFVDNHIARCDYLADVGPSEYHDPDPDYTGNTLVEVGAVQRPSDPASPQTAELPFDPGENMSATAPHGYDTYQRKRWTGPEFAVGAVPKTER
jgi:hypothetical protein